MADYAETPKNAMFWFCIVLCIHKSWKAGWWCTLNLQSKLRGHGDGINMRCFWVRSQKFWAPPRSFVCLQRIQRFCKLTHNFFGGREKFCKRMQSCLGEGKCFEREHNISLVKANVLQESFLGEGKTFVTKRKVLGFPQNANILKEWDTQNFLGEVKSFVRECKSFGEQTQ